MGAIQPTNSFMMDGMPETEEELCQTDADYQAMKEKLETRTQPKHSPIPQFKAEKPKSPKKTEALKQRLEATCLTALRLIKKHKNFMCILLILMFIYFNFRHLFIE